MRLVASGGSFGASCQVNIVIIVTYYHLQHAFYHEPAAGASTFSAACLKQIAFKLHL